MKHSDLELCKNKNNTCDPSFSSSVIKDVRNKTQDIRFKNERK